MTYAFNHMVAPRLGHKAFFALAKALGVGHVEMRNDLNGVATLDGTSAAEVGRDAKQAGVQVLTINGLQRFNDWSPERAAQAKVLIDDCVAIGAKALVLVPVNDTAYRPSPAEARRKLEHALRELKALLNAAGILGYVEPLGFEECSLRFKGDAVAAIEAVGAGDTFKLVHDTFHHFVAGEAAMYPGHTGLVHISGVSDAAATAATMRDPHRVHVTAGDRIGNVGQIKALRAGGYEGPLSMEPFSAEVHGSPTLPADVKASLDHLKAAL